MSLYPNKENKRALPSQRNLWADSDLIFVPKLNADVSFSLILRIKFSIFIKKKFGKGIVF